MENGRKVRGDKGLREFAGAVNETVQVVTVPVPSQKSYADQEPVGDRSITKYLTVRSGSVL
jgi:hypothetical protein